MRLRILAAVFFIAACSRKIEGPTPLVGGAVNERDHSTGPAYLCNAQGDPADGWLVDALGDRFAPLPTNSLAGTPGVAMPAVKLDGPESYTLPEAYVRFTDRTRMPLAMRTADSAADPHTLPPGDYALTVTNLNGASASAAAAVRVVPPPKVSSVSLAATAGGPSGTSICADVPQTLTITGTGFRTDKPVTVTIGTHTFTATASSDTTVTVSIPAGTFTAAETSATGTAYTVVLTNPEGCHAPAGSDPLAPATVQAFPSCTHLGVLSISPRFGWQQQNTSVTITNQFQQPASQPFSQGAPKAFITAPLLNADGSQTAPQDIPLRHMAVVDDKTVTAQVPTCSGMSALPQSSAAPCVGGIAPGGPYDVKVIDQIDGAGSIAGAFTVVANPTPVITSLNPSSITTSGGTVTITGTNFDVNGQHATAWLGAQVTGGVEFCQMATGTVSDTSIAATVPPGSASCYVEDAFGARTSTGTAFPLAQGQYLVRVQHATPANGGDVSSGDFAALIVTNASFNPSDVGTTGQATLNTARGDHGTAVGTDDLGNPFLYAAGGSTGAAPLASVEVAPIGLFGDVGGACTAGVCKFRELTRTPLPTAREGFALVARTVPGDTTYLYAIGGKDATPAVLTDVLRAQVLRNKDAPVMAEIASQAGGTLSAGTYYYRISAMVPAGETLPSDEESVVVDGSQAAVVHWQCISTATAYRVYRTASPDQRSNTETLLTTATPVCGATGTVVSFTDDGSASCASNCSDAPLPAGALSDWVDLSATAHLGTGRYDFQARLVGDDIWALGGCTNAAGCTSSGSVATVERFTFPTTGDILTPATGAAAGTMLQARDQHAVAVASPQNANTGSDTYLLVFGGEVNGTEISKTNAASGASIELALVNPGGTLTFPAPSNSTGWKGAPQNVGRGGWAEAAANQAFFEMALTGSLTPNASSSSLCGSSTCSITAATSFSFNFNAGFPQYGTGGARFLLGEQLFRAYVYAVGGFASTSTLTPTDTVERVVY